MSETSKIQKYLMWYKVKELFSNGLNKSQIGISLGLGRVKKQVQHYNKNLKNSSLGVEKFNFSLGLRLIFNCTE